MPPVETQIPKKQFRLELANLAARIGFARPIRWSPMLVHLVLLAAFGVFLPWLKGVTFMDPAMPTIYACLGPFFAAPAAVQLIRQQEGPQAHALAKVFAATLYGEGMTLLILILAFSTVLLGHSQAYLFLPDPILLGEAILLGLGSTVALTALSTWSAIQFSPGTAMTVLRVGFVALFAFFYLLGWWLVAMITTAVAISFLALPRYSFLIAIRKQ